MKPLTKGRREEIEILAITIETDPVDDEYRDALHDLIAAEAFWREALKAAKTSRQTCAWCGYVGIKNHNSDCPWVLAQDQQ